MKDDFTTTVSDVREGAVILRGYSLEDVMTSCTYTEGAFLTIVGRLPGAAERRLLDAVLTSLLDHGFVASTVAAGRYIASGNPQLVPAVAGSLLAAGRNTVSPEHSFGLLQRAFELQAEHGWDATTAAAAVVDETLAAGARLPGFGHPTHKSGDFRATVIFELADELGLAGRACEMYQLVYQAMTVRSGKRGIPINIDGCMACVGYDLGLNANQVVSFALLSVLPGLMAHIIEEIDAGIPLRHITHGAYEGPDRLSLNTDHANGDTADGHHAERILP